MKDTAERRILSRRTFNRLAAGSAAAAAAGSMLAPESALAEEGSPAVPEGTYFDFHTHLTQIWGNRPPLSAGALIHWMNENDISQAVVHPLESPEAWDHPIPTHYVLEQTSSYRHRLIPAAVIDPRVLNLTLGGQEKVSALLNRYVDFGARVFGVHQPGMPIADTRNIDMFASVADAGLPVLFHMDERSNTDEVGLPGLEHVLSTYPNTAFVGSGPGFWASVSGDATNQDVNQEANRTVTPGGAVVRLMETHANLYGDLSGASGAAAVRRDPAFAADFITDHADRLIWGSGYYVPGQNVEQFDLYHDLGLSDEVQRRVFRDNARRLIGLID